MFGLPKHGPDGRAGVVIDVGSASITLAVVISEPGQKLPTVIWSHKERMHIGELDDISQAAKNIATACVNAFLLLGTDGITALVAHDKNASLSITHVTVGAPWSYTITKTVSSSNEEPFTITKALLGDLRRVAKEQSMEILEENPIFSQLGLEVISEDKIDTRANGYIVANPIGQEVESVSVSHLTGVSQKQLIKVIRDSHDKVVPKTTLQLNTFMYTFYLALRSLLPETTEICLIDVSGEATEIGIVRDGVLRYATHMPYGYYTLAREISELCGVPYEEALGALKDNCTHLRDRLSAAKREELDVILQAYVAKATDLFGRTGDTLSIPKPVYIHTDGPYESFFAEHIASAAQLKTGLEHTVHGVTGKYFTDIEAVETKTLLSAFVFHKNIIDPVSGE